MAGWIKLSRDITEHWIWQDAERLKWWQELLFMASWEDKKVMHDTHLFTLKKGQIIASVATLSKKWDKSAPTIIKFLKLLESDGMIKRETLYRQTSIITICNYDKYQGNDDTKLYTQIDTIVDTKLNTQVDTQVDTIVYTYKEIKENKEIKNNINYNNNAREEKKLEEKVETDKPLYAEDENPNPQTYFDEAKNSPIWQDLVAKQYEVTKNKLPEYLDKFQQECLCKETTHLSMNDYKSHFCNWLRIQRKEEKRDAERLARQQKQQQKQNDDMPVGMRGQVTGKVFEKGDWGKIEPPEQKNYEKGW